MSDLIDTTEMYLRTIYELQEEGIVPLRARIAERLGPQRADRLPDRGPDGARRPAARLRRPAPRAQRRRPDKAMRVMRKHRLAERLLVDVIGLEWEYVHEEACRWEHVISERVERKLLADPGQPDRVAVRHADPGARGARRHDRRRGLPGRPRHAAAADRAGRPRRAEPVEVVVRRLGEPAQLDHARAQPAAQGRHAARGHRAGRRAAGPRRPGAHRRRAGRTSSWTRRSPRTSSSPSRSSCLDCHRPEHA